jgi:hypothetical protein
MATCFYCVATSDGTTLRSRQSFDIAQTRCQTKQLLCTDLHGML